jgi:F420-0:gamma-glutamyl ligase-like protein
VFENAFEAIVAITVFGVVEGRLGEQAVALTPAASTQVATSEYTNELSTVAVTYEVFSDPSVLPQLYRQKLSTTHNKNIFFIS